MISSDTTRRPRARRHSVWLVTALAAVAATGALAQLPLDLSRMSAAPNGDVAPLSGFAGARTVTLANDVARLRYEGPDGTLEYEWRRPQSSADGLYGSILLTARAAGAAIATTSVGTGSSFTWSQSVSAQASAWEAGSEACTLVRTFAAGATTATVRITGRLVGKSLVLHVSCDQPLVSAFEAGTLTGSRPRTVTVPFYTGTILYLPTPNLFTSVLLDWTAGAATSHSATRAVYQARTDGTRLRLDERAIFTAAWHLAEVFPNVPHPPSPWRPHLADKVVLDIWGGSFATIARNLEALADHDVTNCVALIHVWQRSGYDNALPAHLPAQAALGGDAEMAVLTATARRLGYRCALHENYVDYYPNYELFDPADIALNSSGGRINAWFNEATQIQSFAIQPNAVLRLAATQSPEIHRRFGTTASYLDVNPAVAPWFHVDQRAGEEGAGTFARVREIHRQLFAYERVTHEGPLFGEGHRHWYWGGLLDGVEAQFGAGWPGNGGLTAPLLPDFDLLRVHPQMVNHGMGYYSRWYPEEDEATFAGPPPLLYLDRYRLQEVAYGHAPFLGSSIYASIPLAWLEHHLVSPVAARYGTASPREILYEGDGGAWIDATALAKRDQPLAQRVRVRYDNGLTVTANSAETSLAAGTWMLPPLGWLAEGAGVTAGTVLRRGIICDFADTGDTFFANARSALDWNLSTFRDVRPAVADWQQTGPRALRVTYRWTVQDRLAKDYRCFVHFTSGTTIRWQQDHTLTPPTSEWQVNQVVADGPFNVTIPATIADGDYRWLIGLYDQTGTSGRVRLRGVDGGGSTILLGVLQVRDNGASLAFVPATGDAPDYSARDRARLNLSSAVVDFGAVRTDGSVRLRREAGEWVLKVWPRSRPFQLELNQARFPRPTTVRGSARPGLAIETVAAGECWQLPLDGSGEYRWSAGAAEAPIPTRLVNLSSLVSLRPGRPTATAGFVIGGSTPARVLIRAVGPALAGFGVATPLADPRLTLLRPGAATPLLQNDNWGLAANAAEIPRAASQAGAFPLPAGSSDSALLAILEPGAYTAQVTGPAGATGDVLIEVYQVHEYELMHENGGNRMAPLMQGRNRSEYDARRLMPLIWGENFPLGGESENPVPPAPRLANLSTLAAIDSGQSTVTAGFALAGTVPAQVLIRAVGPSLSGFGVTSPLADPRLVLLRAGASTPLLQNDNWGLAGNAAEMGRAAAQAGAFALPAGSADSALLVTLEPGAYTVQVTGPAGAAGEVLVEVYQLP